MKNKESEKINKYLDLVREVKKKHEDDIDTYCRRYVGTVLKGL